MSKPAFVSKRWIKGGYFFIKQKLNNLSKGQKKKD